MWSSRRSQPSSGPTLTTSQRNVVNCEQNLGYANLRTGAPEKDRASINFATSRGILRLSGSIHPKIVREILAHAQISVTLDTYFHVLPGMQDKEVKAITKLFTEEVNKGWNRSIIAGSKTIE
jgi:hypothetical protein